MRFFILSFTLSVTVSLTLAQESAEDPLPEQPQQNLQNFQPQQAQQPLPDGIYRISPFSNPSMAVTHTHVENPGPQTFKTEAVATIRSYPNSPDQRWQFIWNSRDALYTIVLDGSRIFDRSDLAMSLQDGNAFPTQERWLLGGEPRDSVIISTMPDESGIGLCLTYNGPIRNVTKTPCNFQTTDPDHYWRIERINPGSSGNNEEINQNTLNMLRSALSQNPLGSTINPQQLQALLGQRQPNPFGQPTQPITGSTLTLDQFRALLAQRQSGFPIGQSIPIGRTFQPQRGNIVQRQPFNLGQNRLQRGPNQVNLGQNRIQGGPIQGRPQNIRPIARSPNFPNGITQQRGVQPVPVQRG